MAAAAMARATMARVSSIPPGRFHNFHKSFVRRMSDEAKKPDEVKKQLKMAEEIVKGLKEPNVQENTPKLIKMVEDLMKTLKKPQSEELTLDRIRLQNVQDQLSELKAHTKLTSAVIFSILGVFGCLLISLPNGVLKVELMSQNSQRS